MNSAVVITIVVVAAFIWLAVLIVAALRSRGSEEVPSNLAPGASDEIMETKRLERAQQAAVVLSAFLAIGLPLYYLGETQRQDTFVTDFAQESVARGLAHWTEYKCFNCHGADGGGGVALYTEKRTGVQVSWTAPSINDVFYRYNRDQVRYWLIYGRQNSPMPAWGTDGGGPMSSQQIEELLDYLASPDFQISQDEAVAKVEPAITTSLAALDGADAAIAGSIVTQSQLVANLKRAPELEPVMADIAGRATQLVANLGNGIDTDGDGVADVQEVAVNQLTQEAKQALLLPGVAEVAFDATNPESNGTPDKQAAEDIVATYRGLVADGRAPVLGPIADAIQTAIDTPGDDGDGDGLSDQAETIISGQTSQAVASILPQGFVTTNLDPSNPETVTGESDLATANAALSELSTVYTNIRLNSQNGEKLIPAAETALANLQQAARDRKWEFDFPAIADQSFGGDVDKAKRVVGIWEAYCARCHTSGWSAGVAFAQQAGSGALGPALWDGREAVQFLSDGDLEAFLEVGGLPNQPYGVNGMAKENGPMPGFGLVLSKEDLTDLSHWLRGGDLTGKGTSQ
jgi:mono/diheme cytochrome c family protein